MISDELYEVLKAWLIDATSTSPSSEVRFCGLCAQPHIDEELTSEMRAFWREQRLHEIFPFNLTEGEYYHESNSGTCHLNPRRLAWVKERIAEYDQTLAMYEEEKRT